MRRDLPAGTVTFLFTDVEGSTKLLHEFGAETYAEKLAEHRRVIRDACAARDGALVRRELAADRLKRCWGEGRAMTPDQLVAFAVAWVDGAHCEDQE